MTQSVENIYADSKIIKINLSCWKIPKDSLVWRIPPCQVLPHAIESIPRFEHQVIFYDVFYSYDRTTIICIGPPVLNLNDVVNQATFYTTSSKNPNEREKISLTKIVHLDRCEEFIFSVKNSAHDVLICESIFGIEKLPIGQNFSHILYGKNLITTKNKNNNLKWIADWANFNVIANEIDTILLFNNNSDAYSETELFNFLAVNTIIDKIFIIDTPYSFGLSGTPFYHHEEKKFRKLPWYDYMQYALLQISFLRFARKAKSIISCDIDELPLTNDGEPLHSKLENEPEGVLYLPSVNMITCMSKNTRETVEFESSLAECSSEYFKYLFFGKHSYKDCHKYIVDPNMLSDRDQLAVHWICKNRKKFITSSNLQCKVYHFIKIGTFWAYGKKYKFAAPTIYEPSIHQLSCVVLNFFINFCKQMPDYTFNISDIARFAVQIGACSKSTSSLSVSIAEKACLDSNEQICMQCQLVNFCDLDQLVPAIHPELLRLKLTSTLSHSLTIMHDSSENDNLTELYNKYFLNNPEYFARKNSYNNNLSLFISLYNTLFKNLRYHVKYLFECGVCNANTENVTNGSKDERSTRILDFWRDYFPNAFIYGATLDESYKLNEDRVYTYYLDQTSQNSIASLCKSIHDSIKFNIIIDNGLLDYPSSLIFFKNSIQKLANNGSYIIENVQFNDLHNYKQYFSQTQYDVNYIVFGNPEVKNQDANMVLINNSSSKINFAKNMARSILTI